MTRDRKLDAALREDRRQHRKTKPSRPPSYWRRHRVQKCECGGYWFPHRRTGGACIHSTTASYYVARRYGATHEEALEALSAAGLRKLLPIAGDR